MVEKLPLKQQFQVASSNIWSATHLSEREREREREREELEIYMHTMNISVMGLQETKCRQVRATFMLLRR
eukprot:3551478-Prorocentrum_lima.AAC.1